MTSTNSASPRLFVGSLPYKFTEGQLLSLFIPFGRVIAVSIIHNQWGKSRGLGFIEFDNLASAIEAKKHLHNFLVEDRTIIVDFSKPDPSQTPEGQQRHLEAQQRRELRHPHRPSSPSSQNDQSRQPKTPRPISRIRQSSEHLRQSVFDARFHGARAGRKFSSRTKKRSTN